MTPRELRNINFKKLNYCISEWRESFNDCACCPLYPYECEGEDEDITREICVKRIIRWINDADEVIILQ